MGKYLSPKLYLSYGVGIFTPGEVITLRYKLSRMWELEAQNATTENRAGLNYRLPAQDLEIDFRRLPALPRSGFRMMTRRTSPREGGA